MSRLLLEPRHSGDQVPCETPVEDADQRPAKRLGCSRAASVTEGNSPDFDFLSRPSRPRAHTISCVSAPSLKSPVPVSAAPPVVASKTAMDTFIADLTRALERVVAEQAAFEAALEREAQMPAELGMLPELTNFCDSLESLVIRSVAVHAVEVHWPQLDRRSSCVAVEDSIYGE